VSAPACDNGSAQRVLVVDDELLIRWSLNEALSERGYIVAEAADGGAALRVLGNGNPLPNVVLLDFRLPDSNSLDLLSQIRRLAPEARVILMTAFSTPEVVQGALDCGALGVLAKPFDVHQLDRLIGRARTS
jgi:DNA-binding NtrC family response regulator